MTAQTARVLREQAGREATVRRRVTGAPSPLTGPIVVREVDPAAHWWPQYDEPVYAAMYADHVAQLAAGLAGDVPLPALDPAPEGTDR